MNKQTFITTLLAERAQWDALLAEIGEARMMQPAVGEWTVKDIIAHTAWYEREMVEVLRARALVGSDLWGAPLEERNAAIFEENRHRPLAEVLAEARQVFAQLLEELQSLSDEDLSDPRRFREMPAEWMPWQVIASNCFEHYPQHIPELRAWLDAQTKTA